MVDQDHRVIKCRVRAMQGFRAFYSAWRTIQGIEYDPQGTSEVVSEERHCRAGCVHRIKLSRSDFQVCNASPKGTELTSALDAFMWSMVRQVTGVES